MLPFIQHLNCLQMREWSPQKKHMLEKEEKRSSQLQTRAENPFWNSLIFLPDQDIHREEFLLKLFFSTEHTVEEMQHHCDSEA